MTSSAPTAPVMLKCLLQVMQLLLAERVENVVHLVRVRGHVVRAHLSTTGGRPGEDVGGGLHMRVRESYLSPEGGGRRPGEDVGGGW